MSSIHILDKNTELIKDFLTNKPNEKIVIEDKHVRNIENHTETFDFIVDLKASENINMKDRVIIPSENKGEYREFIVDDIDTNTFDGETEIRTTASYLELDKGYPHFPQTLSQSTAQQAVEFALNMVDWEVGEVEYAGIRTMSWTSYNSPYEVLKIIATRFDLQLDFTIETEGNKITKRLVHLRNKEALFNGKEVSRGKDLSSLTVERQSADIVTALVALAPEPPEPEEGEEKKERLVIYLRDEEAQSKYGRGQDYLWSVYEPESEDSDMTEARLRTLATTELNKRKEAKVDYSIDAIDLEQFLGHEQVRLGDKIKIKDDLQAPYFYADAVAKEISRSIFNPLDKTYVLGEVVEYTREQILATWESFREYFTKRLQETQSRLDNIVTIIDTEVEKRIFRGATPPENPINGQLWLDTSNPDKAVLKEYINGMWVIRIDNPSEEDIEAISRATAMYESIVSQLRHMEALQMQLFTRANKVKDDEYLNEFHRNNLNDKMSAVIGTYNILKTEVDKYKNSKKVTLQQANYIQQLMINYSNMMNELNTAIIEAENYALKHLEILQQQYTDEKFNEAVETTAERLGFIVEDGVIKIGENTALSGLVEIINESTEEQLKSVVRVSDYEADKAGIIERLDASDSERTQLSNQIKDRVTLTDYNKDKDENSGRIKTLETSIEQNGKAIELKASKTDIDSVRKTLSDTKADLTVRADSIETNVRGLNDDLELTKSTIQQTSDNINLRINTLNIGGDNLIPKADFSLYNSPPQGWSAWGSSNYLNSNIIGGKVLLAQTPNPNNNSNTSTLGFQSPHLFKDVKEGKFYTLSWYANTSASFDSAFRYCFLMNPSGSNQNLATPEIVSTGNSIADMSQTYTQYKLTFKANFSGRAYVLIGGHYSANTYAFIYMSEPQLEEGEFATSFKASTEETIKQDNLVSSINLDTSGTKIQGKQVDINANDINLTANNSFNSLVTDVSKISSSIASGTVRYSGVDRTNWRDLVEVDGSQFNDQYSYDVTAKVRGTNTETLIASLTSKGSGNGWDLSVREDNGGSAWRPQIYTISSGGARIRTAGTTASTWTIEVSYNKYIGTGTGMSWADSKITQTANNITLEVNKKTDESTVRSLISQSATNINLRVDTAQDRADSAWSRASTGINNAASADTKASNAATVAGRAEGKIDGLEVGADNLIPDSGWHKEPSGSYLIPNNWRNPVGGIVWSGRQNSYWMLIRVNNSSDGSSGSTSNSYYGLRTPSLSEPLVEGQEYTFTFKARNLAGSNYNFSYTYVIYDNNNPNQRIIPTRIKNVDNAGQLWSVTFTSRHNDTAHILIGHSGISGEHNAFYLKEPILAKGNRTTPWSDSILNKPDKDKIITEINLTQDTAEISAQKIQLNGDLIKVNGQMRVGDINFNRATATGGSGTSTLKMQGDMVELRGNYTRQWRGSTATENVYTVMEKGHMRFRNESRDRTLFYSDFGISTYADGRGANEDSSGTISFFDHTYSPTARGLLAHSTWGVVGLKSDNNRIILESGKSNFVYAATPRMRVVTDPDKPTDYSEFQAGEVLVKNIRANEGESNFYIGVSTNELRVTNNLFYNGGNTGYRPVRAWTFISQGGMMMENHAAGNSYIGVGTGELRITNNNGYNGGNTTYRTIRSNGIALEGMITTHFSGDNFYFGVGGSELRITDNNGSSGNYRDIRARNFYKGTSSSPLSLFSSLTEKPVKNEASQLIEEIDLVRYKTQDYPEYDTFGTSAITPQNSEEKDGVDIGQATMLLVKANQELIQSNRELQDKIEQQEERLNKLEELLL
ncbi:phage tail spike protein [Corticicoccus populi]|uniref:Phage tail spike protein n=1 Tax=Corticicoccus populi TaxID=1812821 RepID=A0ABW5WTI6_9STAP